MDDIDKRWSDAVNHYADKFIEMKERNEKLEMRILELLEQNRQLKAKCKRLDEYDDLVDTNNLLLESLQALGVKPDGYCFCLNQEQIYAGHTGECIMAQRAIAKAEGE